MQPNPSPKKEIYLSHSHTAQQGEDLMIDSIIKKLPLSENYWCVEFGAWDGKHLSNTYYFIAEKNWHSVLIEGEKNRFLDLKHMHGNNPRCHLLNAYVDFKGKNTLDNLLATTPIPNDFDVLSIDIDGNDYHVWESVVGYHPKLVVIEFNQSIPNDIKFIQSPDLGVNQGNSLLALYELAERKGYSLCATTLCNAFFIRTDLLSYLSVSPEAILHNYKVQAPRLFQLYDGTLVLSNPIDLIWRKHHIGIFDLQAIPKQGRGYGKPSKSKNKLVHTKQRVIRRLIRWLEGLLD